MLVFIRRAVAFTFVLGLAVACGKFPTLGTTEIIGGEDAGKSSSGGSGSGSSSSGSDAAPAGDAAPSNVGGWLPTGCTSFDPTKVYFSGAVVAGSGPDGLVRLDAPQSPCLVFETSDAVIRPDGTLVYIDNGTPTVRIYSQDPLVWNETDKVWEAPTGPNTDVEIPTADCTQGVASIAVTPDDGVLYHQCLNDSAYAWYDATGTSQTPANYDLVFGYGGARLGYDRQGLSTPPSVILKDGTVIPATGLPSVANSNQLYGQNVRPTSDGFFVVVPQSASDYVDFDLWKIALDGTATQIGSFGAIPAGYTPTGGIMQLDPDGNLYEYVMANGDGGGQIPPDAIVLRKVGGVASQVVYDESNTPSDTPNLNVTPPQIYAQWHGSFFISASTQVR